MKKESTITTDSHKLPSEERVFKHYIGCDFIVTKIKGKQIYNCKEI